MSRRIPRRTLAAQQARRTASVEPPAPSACFCRTTLSAMSDEEAAGPSQQPAGDGETQIAAPKLPNLSNKRLKKLHDKEKAKGVVYLSRIPPHLVSGGWCMQVWRRLAASCAQLLPPAFLPQKPQKLRQLLQQYAEIGRVYLAPEGAPPAAAATPCTPAVARTGELQGWFSFWNSRHHTDVLVVLEGCSLAVILAALRRQRSLLPPPQPPPPPPTHLCHCCPPAARLPQTPRCARSANRRAATAGRTSRRGGWSLRTRQRQRRCVAGEQGWRKHASLSTHADGQGQQCLVLGWLGLVNA